MKRGSSGLSLVCGVDKPTGMSSHDVVNRARRIFSERRVGHAGTLDPLASGVLPILVGPATRLSDYLMGHDKDYIVDIAFGYSTTTDDAEGDVLRSGDVVDEVFDPFFASTFVASLVGKSMQIPPIYSAIKVDGKKAYDEARKGRIIEMKPREIEVFSAKLISIENDFEPTWRVAFRVSKGTYIRSLARDVGNAIGVPAHVGALRRLSAGRMRIQDCVGLDTLEDVGVRASLDPVRLLGFRFFFGDDRTLKKLANGNVIDMENVDICEYATERPNSCSCTSGVMRSCASLDDGELVCAVLDNKLKSIYRFDAHTSTLKPECVFQIGVERGSHI